MLVLALAFAGVAFALLVSALVTGDVLWAWSCIAVSLVGVVLLFADILSGRTHASISEPAPQWSAEQEKPGSEGVSQQPQEQSDSELPSESDQQL
ncbi:MAG: hypothetical protein ACRCSF_12410 [Mycobacteriaceae bacterium]